MYTKNKINEYFVITFANVQDSIFFARSRSLVLNSETDFFADQFFSQELTSLPRIRLQHKYATSDQQKQPNRLVL